MLLNCMCTWYDQGVAAGVLRGAGKQLIGALCNLVAVYFIGFPIGVSLMFAAKMGVVGKTKILMWTTMFFAFNLTSIIQKVHLNSLSISVQDCGQALPFVCHCRR